MRDPYVLLKETISINESVQELSCQDYKLYTCLNSSLYNPNHSFVTLRRRLGVWLLVNQTRPWEGSPEIHALLKVIKKVLLLLLLLLLSRFSRVRLCDPLDGSPPGAHVPGTLQARTLEWVAISFSNAWKGKVKVKSLSHVRLSDPMDCSLPGSSVHGIFQARVLEWVAITFSRTLMTMLHK